MNDEKKPKYDWRYENSINTKDVYLELGVAGDPKYDQFRTNKSFSNYPDTVMHAQEVNMSYGLDNKLHYDYLFHSIRKKKRFFKVRPKGEHDDMFALVQSYYKYSNKKTYETLAVLTDEQLAIIRKKMDKGGVK